MTGQHLGGTPITIEKRQDQINALHVEIFGSFHTQPQAQASPETTHNDIAETPDAELIERISNSKNSNKFRDLMYGDPDFIISQSGGAGYPSLSEADLALCNILAFWTRKNPDQMDRIFRQSGLYRPKWDEYRGSQTYGEITINEAIATTVEVWKGGKRRKARPKGQKPGSDPIDFEPGIIINKRQLSDITQEAIGALVKSNDPPYIFKWGTGLARIRPDATGQPIIENLGENLLRERLAKISKFYRTTDNGLTDALPPRDLTQNILAADSWPFPPIMAITETPIIRPDGSIISKSGYDPETCLFYAPAKNLKIPEIPLNPTQDQLNDAVNLIWETIGEFPYVSNADKANAFGLLITPVVRPTINGCVPMALIDAPSPGTGKGLLSQVMPQITVGRHTGSMVATQNDDEMRKMITSELLKGSMLITIDNVEFPLWLPSLASALTASVWNDRLLGKTKQLSLPQRAVWIANGNNIQLRGDLPRRCYPIKIDAKMAEPWKRTGFKHPDLLKWVRENRGHLLGALLTIARAWFAAGRPAWNGPTMGSFEGWVEIVGGILAHAGVTGFLENLNQFYAKADQEAVQWEVFLRTWQEIEPNTITSGGLAKLIDDHETLMEALPDSLLAAKEKAKSDSGFTKSLKFPGSPCKARTFAWAMISMSGCMATSISRGEIIQVEQSLVGKVLSNWAMTPPREMSCSTR